MSFRVHTHTTVWKQDKTKTDHKEGFDTRKTWEMSVVDTDKSIGIIGHHGGASSSGVLRLLVVFGTASSSGPERAACNDILGLARIGHDS